MEQDNSAKNKEQTPDIEDILKNFINRVSSAVPAETNPKDIPIHEQLPEISQEFAGIVFALNQIISSRILTQRQGVNLIRQFYEYETGKTLRVSFLENIVMHEKVKNYETRIMPNIMKRFTKDESLRKLQEDESSSEPEAQKNDTSVVLSDLTPDLDPKSNSVLEPKTNSVLEPKTKD